MRPVLDDYLVATTADPETRQGCHECGFTLQELNVDAAAATVVKYDGIIAAMGPRQVAEAVILAAATGERS